MKRIGAGLFTVFCCFGFLKGFVPETQVAGDAFDIDVANESGVGAGVDLDFVEKERFDIKNKRKEVIKLVNETIKFIEKKPFNEAMSYLSHTHDFKHGELYPFVYSDKGVCLAHGEDISMVWKDMSKENDSFGAPFVLEMIEKAAAGGGWQTYLWRGTAKDSYAKMMEKDGQKLVVGCGFYPHSKSDSVLSLVKSAVTFFNERIEQNVRPVEIISNFNYQLGDFILGDLYLYVFNKDSIMLAHGNMPGQAGQSYYDTKDDKGKFFIRNMVDVMKDVPLGEGRWFDYIWLKAPKKAYVERVVDAKGTSYFIASGYQPTVDREAAVALVKRGYQFMKAHGRSAIVEAINDQTRGEFKYGPLDLFIYDYKGVPIAYGANISLVGKSLIDLKDQSGRYVVREIIKKAKDEGAGWLDFRWRKSFFSMYIEDIDLGSEKFIIGTGVYPITKESTMVLMVKSAKGYFKVNNKEDALRGFVDPSSNFIRGDISIFVLDTDGICYADGDRFDRIWKDISNEKDDDGRFYVKAMINAVKMGPAKIIYKENNARKVAYVESVKKGEKTFIIGSSFYP